MTNTVQELKFKDEQYILAQFILINSFIASQFILVIEYQTPIYPITHATVPQPTSSSSKSTKSKKKSILHALKKKDLISLLKQSLQDVEDDSNNEFNASSETSIANDDNPYYSYDLYLNNPMISSLLLSTYTNKIVEVITAVTRHDTIYRQYSHCLDPLKAV